MDSIGGNRYDLHKGLPAMLPIKDYLHSKSFPFVNTVFIALNAVVFVHQVRLPLSEAQALVMQYAFIAQRFFSAPVEHWSTPFSSMFLHGGFVHFIGNMLFLFVFGDNVEDAFGHIRYLLFYLLAGFAAAFAQTAFMPDPSIPLIGASGAISAVLGAYIILYPMARVLTIIPIGFFLMSAKLPAYLFVGVWALLQLFSGMLTIAGGLGSNIGYFAHLGGFAFGFVFAAAGRRRYLQKFHRHRRVFYNDGYYW